MCLCSIRPLCLAPSPPLHCLAVLETSLLPSVHTTQGSSGSTFTSRRSPRQFRSLASTGVPILLPQQMLRWAVPAMSVSPSILVGMHCTLFVRPCCPEAEGFAGHNIFSMHFSIEKRENIRLHEGDSPPRQCAPSALELRHDWKWPTKLTLPYSSTPRYRLSRDKTAPPIAVDEHFPDPNAEVNLKIRHVNLHPLKFKLGGSAIAPPPACRSERSWRAGSCRCGCTVRRAQPVSDISAPQTP